jgi:hypothetical protein
MIDGKDPKTNLESFILQHLLNGNVFALFGRAYEFCLKYNTKRAIPDHFAVGIREVFCFTRFAVGCNNFDNLVWIVDG